MSQAEVVEGICSIAYLSKVENGKAKPSTDFLKSISERLNVTFEMLNNENKASFQEELELLLQKIETEKINLSSEQENFLKMALLEFISPLLLIRVVSILLKNLIDRNLLNEADKLYETYVKLIDLSSDVTKKAPDEQRIYYKLHHNLGTYFYKKQKFNQADEHYSIAESLLRDEISIESAQLYYNISLVKQRILSDKTLSLQYSEKSYTIFERESAIEDMVRALITMGVQYNLLEKYDQSLSALKKAENYLETIDTVYKSDWSLMISYNIGRLYHQKNDYETAILYYNKTAEKNENEIYKIYIFKEILKIKIKQKEWPSVNELLNEALLLSQKNKQTNLEIELYWIKATFFKERGDYVNYEKWIKHAIELAKAESYSNSLKDMAEELANYYYEERFYKKSSEYYKLALQNVKI